MSWLPVHLSANIKIVLTTLPDRHDLLRRLQTEVLKDCPGSFVQVQPLSLPDSQTLLNHFLSNAGRSAQQGASPCLSGSGGLSVCLSVRLCLSSLVACSVSFPFISNIVIFFLILFLSLFACLCLFLSISVFLSPSRSRSIAPSFYMLPSLSLFLSLTHYICVAISHSLYLPLFCFRSFCLYFYDFVCGGSLEYENRTWLEDSALYPTPLGLNLSYTCDDGKPPKMML